MTQTRLSWWAVLLPAAVFSALLTLLLTSPDPAAGAVVEQRPLPQLVETVRQVWPS
ncbi:hypothetical protein ACTWP5_23025 [Streptomyces sp. 4N509B]|uniref:hypothetical protein n=1 Tax=Streptomyces sp. 4N509B TaxID=3457413 RepID=UPI003FD2D4FD